MADFEIYVPHELSFSTYIQVVQVARAWSDGYDRKDANRLRSALASNITVDYSAVVPAWGEKKYTATDFIDLWLSEEHLGLKVLVTQHLLGQPYFKFVSATEIVVEWQLIASHGRRAPSESPSDPMSRIEEQSNHRAFIEHTMVRSEDRWRISHIRPSVLFQPGDFMHVRRKAGT